MNDIEPNERTGLNKEVSDTLGVKTKESWDNADTKLAHQKAVEEFARKSPAAREAWFNKETRPLMKPQDLNTNLDAQAYQNMFHNKSKSMRSVFGANPVAKPFIPKGGKKTRKYKKSKKSKRTRVPKSKAKKSHKKRPSRRYRR